jgi:uncharacterized coiled-coil protein SlyX
MPRSWISAPRLIFFFAGAAVGILTRPRSRQAEADQEAIRLLKHQVADLSEKVTQYQAAVEERLQRAESRIEGHTVELAEVPSTQRIVSAVEALLARTMSGLDERLSAQAAAIEALKTTVTETDKLLERVLESLDSLQSEGSPQSSATDSEPSTVVLP